MFQRVLIANRGEIAVRILRACREIGVDAVTVYSAADADSLHVQLSPNAVCIGPAKAADSYLNVDALLTVAKRRGATPSTPATASCRRTRTSPSGAPTWALPSSAPPGR